MDNNGFSDTDILDLIKIIATTATIALVYIIIKILLTAF